MQGILDYSTTDGRKHFERATRPVNGELFFDATAEGLFGFIKDVETHAQKFGWTTEFDGIFWIPDDVNNPDGADATFKNLLASYGEMSIEHVREWEETYIDVECREAQDSVQAHHSLRSSLSKTALDKVNIYKSEYTINGTPSGALFFKIIIRESVLDTNATALSIRARLGSAELTKHVESVSFDVSKFNQHVLMLIESLRARGETTSDLLANLFVAYANVKDEEFKQCVMNRRSEFEDGTREFTYQQLMVLLENKHKNLVQAERWSHESYEDKFMALQAKQEKTTRDFEKLKRKKDNDKGGDGGKGRSQKGGKRDDLPAWMKVEPSPDKLKEPREWKGKPWCWCSEKTGGKCNPGHHRRHKPSECRGTASVSKKKRKAAEKEENRKLKVAKAIARIDDGDSESE